MANQWAIAIGINTYRAFQSLHFAQHDAEALCRHLIDSGITAPENCLLLTTASALHRGHSTFPERETIARWLKGLVTGVMGPEDSLILFFSGYGVHAGGEDYLMPVDGDPADAAATGIAVKSIYRLLAQVPSGRVLVALDMNRNAGSLGEPAGAFTARLAQQASQQLPGIATLLSCKPPDQFARESSGVRHGFFTAGILEVMRGRQREQPGEMLALRDFGDQLSRRMAELCEHYWRPVQTPVVIGHYQIPLGRAAAGSFVSPDGGSQSEGWNSGQEAQMGAQESGSANPILQSPVLQETLEPNSGKTEIDANPGSPNPGSNGSTVPLLTPLDISRPADISAGFGDDFASTWAWSLDEESQNSGGNNPGSNRDESPGMTIDSGSNDFGGSEGLDPYALAWEEDFGDTVPFDANSELVLNAQAQLERQANEQGADAELTDRPELATGGRPGHGGDGTDWHWADLVVAEATEDGPSDSSSDNEASLADLDGSSRDQSSDLNSEPIFEYRDRPTASSPTPPLNGFPEPGPQGGVNGSSNGSAADFAGTGLVVAAPLNPTQAMLEAEDPNWNWNGDEAAIDVETHGAGNHDLGNHSSGNSPGYDNGLGYEKAAYEDPNLDWPDNDFDLLDEVPGGIPIIELDSEELISTPPVEEPVESSRRGEGLPAWLSLRVLGVLGLASIVALGWLGFFRGEKGNGTLPEQLQSKFNLPSFRPGQADEQGNSPAEEDVSSTQNGRSASSPSDSNAQNNSPSGSDVAPKEASEQSNSEQSTLANIDSPESSDLLDGAQQRIEVGQASSLNRAIDAARKIPPSDPTYEQARRSMNQWSQQVLELSQRRAQEGQYLEAIATARLVPSDMTGFDEAQRSISQWQIPAQLEHAKAVIRPGQASSYNRAIGIARNVPAGTRTYGQAQALMQGWANDIFEIAQQRARQGQLGLAIAAARLVPPDMPAHSAAQSAIADWQPQLNQPKPR